MYNMSIESCRNIVLIETWEDWISAHLRKQDRGVRTNIKKGELL